MFQALILAVLLTLQLPNLSTACQKPSVSSTLFPLTNERNSYQSGDVYELVCIPGYEPEYTHQLICQNNDEWLGTIPECGKKETRIRWWILLIVIVVALIIVPCVTPRIYYCIFDERNVKRLELIHSRHRARDFLDGIFTGSSNNDKDDLVVERKSLTFYRMEAASDLNFYENKSPQPLPKRRHNISQDENSTLTASAEVNEERDSDLKTACSAHAELPALTSGTDQTKRTRQTYSSPNFFYEP